MNMRIQTLACWLLALAFLGACEDHRLWDPGKVGHGQHSSSGDGSAASDGSFVGSWHALDSEPGYDAYMLIEAGGQGYLCNEDGKSQALFMLVSKNGHTVMSDYEYGGGDELSLSNSQLQRVGSDHGETYTVRYARVSTVPAWCTAQIEEMK
jgi:hypothetical protein